MATRYIIGSGVVLALGVAAWLIADRGAMTGNDVVPPPPGVSEAGPRRLPGCVAPVPAAERGLGAAPEVASGVILQPEPRNAEGLTFAEVQARKTSGGPMTPARIGAETAEIEIAALLAESTIQDALRGLAADVRGRIDAALDFYRRHRGTAAEDASALRAELIEAKVQTGNAFPMPRAMTPDSPKPPAPPGAARWAGWPYTVGDTSWWVIITDADSSDYFDLVDLSLEAVAWLRTRVLGVVAGVQPPR